MPKDELAPGYAKARIQGMEGEYYVNAADAKTFKGYRHASFDKERKKIMRYLEEVFSGVYCMTAEEWEDGFRKDTNMDKEILCWLQMAEIYQHFTARTKLTREAKKDYFNIILTVSVSGLDFPRSLIDLQCLPRTEVKEVVEFIRRSKPTAKHFETYMGRGSEQ